ncbi:MAG: hypothetical protein FRX49_07828 [Trebouxia sp. A1-2]|nr:MAG: hypothetical protein FRX49_07828 [Trebouxia sp. A1-2]
MGTDPCKLLSPPQTAGLEKQAETESDVADPRPDVLLAAVCAAEAATLDCVEGKAQAPPVGPGAAVFAVLHAARQAKPDPQADLAVAAAETAAQQPHAAAESPLLMRFVHLIAHRQLCAPWPVGLAVPSSRHDRRLDQTTKGPGVPSAPDPPTSSAADASSVSHWLPVKPSRLCIPEPTLPSDCAKAVLPGAATDVISALSLPSQATGLPGPASGKSTMYCHMAEPASETPTAGVVWATPCHTYSTLANPWLPLPPSVGPATGISSGWLSSVGAGCTSIYVLLSHLLSSSLPRPLQPMQCRLKLRLSASEQRNVAASRAEVYAGTRKRG